ncbi:MAG: hypothetical protein R3234_07580 [Thermoanaerobaculia bacterium]|nr:hypothetical protein [Thermoanaerobaculia bacterium]
MTDSSHGDRLSRALELLRREARSRLEKTPGGARIQGTVDLSVRLPLVGAEELGESRGELDAELDEEIRSLIARRSFVVPGRAFCLRCASSECRHSSSPGPRQVFSGYSPSGVPRFVDYPQLLLEKDDERAAQLFGKRRGVVARRFSSDELTESLVPAYRERFGPVELHGQVAAGWFPLPGEVADEVLAVCYQLLSTGRGRRRRLLLHPVGVAGDDEVRERLLASRGRVPWRPATAWARDVLEQIQADIREGIKMPLAKLRARLDGVLRHLTDRLERPSRRRRRQTGHAQKRHRSRGRPTGSALADLADAPRERIYWDGRNGTFVVLGPKNRTHVFSPEGKLVTSVRYPSTTIERRQRKGQWRPVSPEEARRLEEKVESRLGESDQD